jgi:hypothetical protein
MGLTEPGPCRAHERQLPQPLFHAWGQRRTNSARRIGAARLNIKTERSSSKLLLLLLLVVQPWRSYRIRSRELRISASLKSEKSLYLLFWLSTTNATIVTVIKLRRTIQPISYSNWPFWGIKIQLLTKRAAVVTMLHAKRVQDTIYCQLKSSIRSTQVPGCSYKFCCTS